ncbi:envelope glycoprotein [Simian immunodeficiency virus - agm.tan-1]|uniref:Envelope glycoprotein gp160 n=1 Tax=Simian immunodeficiency virus AGM.tantalus TaxID=349692 RepID=P89909_SIVTA|nr:envelope glycoprotein [Simian immunodeficiency virus - agm.tan-1]UYP40508.1 envelope glycoprotein [synthetic construct]
MGPLRGKGVLLVILGLSLIGLLYGTQYITVFYGIPVWKNSSVQAFCMTPNTNLWATTNCIPDDHDYTEVQLNVSEKFEAWKDRNPLVAQAESNIHLLFESTLKPCVKLTPMCIKMNCTKLTSTAPTSSTPTSSSTTDPCPNTDESSCNATLVTNSMDYENSSICSFAMAGYRRDVKKKYNSTWYDQELVCEKENNTTGTRGCYMIHCNDSVIKEACEKTYWDTLRLRYCAPAGFAILKCKDTNYTGFGVCRNVSVVSCTGLMNTTVSSAFGINGSQAENRTEIWQKHGVSNNSVIIKLNKHYKLKIVCRRPGNKTVLPVTIMAGLVFHSQQYNTKLRQAWCHFQGDWKGAWREVRKTIVELPKEKYRGTNNTRQIWLSRQWGDPEAANIWLNCQGEFFYCTPDWFVNWLNNESNSGRNVDVEGNNCTTGKDKRCYKRTYVPCHIRSIVNDWYTLSKKTYAPPREGHLECTSTVTSMMVSLDYNSKERTNVTLTANLENIWAYELGRYKLIEIEPIGFAPTEIRRYVGPTREKRVPFVLGFLGFLGAAGAAMGATATALTVQSQQLLAGILQQQKNLLAAVEQQQQMLKLTIWGVKNLNARVTALEKYLEDQTRLNLWGCAFKQVCHTTVPWTFNNTPDWDNMTWQEWESQITALEGNISTTLVKAYEQEQKNMDTYQKLGDWTSWWNIFDVSSWFWWIKWGFYIVIGLILFRMAWLIWGCIARVRQGYFPLSPQINIRLGREQPDNAGGEDKDSSSSRDKSPPSVKESLLPNRGGIQAEERAWRQHLTNWCLTISSWLLRLYQILRRSLTTLLQLLRQECQYIQYGWQQFKEGAARSFEALASAAQSASRTLWNACRSAYRAILEHPRRMRQELERWFN